MTHSVVVNKAVLDMELSNKTNNDTPRLSFKYNLDRDQPGRGQVGTEDTQGDGSRTRNRDRGRGRVVSPR